MPIWCKWHNTDTSIDKYGRFTDALIDLRLKFYLENQKSENHVAVKPYEHSRQPQRRYQVLDRVTPQTTTSSSCRRPVRCRIKLEKINSNAEYKFISDGALYNREAIFRIGFSTTVDIFVDGFL